MRSVELLKDHRSTTTRHLELLPDVNSLAVASPKHAIGFLAVRIALVDGPDPISAKYTSIILVPDHVLESGLAHDRAHRLAVVQGVAKRDLNMPGRRLPIRSRRRFAGVVSSS